MSFFSYLMMPFYICPNTTKVPTLFLGTVHYTVYQIFYFKSIHFDKKTLEFLYQEIMLAYLRKVEKERGKTYSS